MDHAADRGLTHIALTVGNMDRSIQFYRTYADLQVIHDRRSGGRGRVVWLADGARPFAIVLIERSNATASLLGIAHLGVALASRESVDRRLDDARKEGLRVTGPVEEPPPVGYYGIIRDPDGNGLELSYGQDIEWQSGHAQPEA